MGSVKVSSFESEINELSSNSGLVDYIYFHTNTFGIPFVAIRLMQKFPPFVFLTK